jgi:hypothetical protein
MAIFAALNALLGIEKGAWTKGMTEAGTEAQAMEQKTGASFKSVNKQMNDLLGKKSDLAKMLKLAAGGGAVAGISMAAKEWESATAKAAEIAQKFHEGSISGSEMAAQIAREIPILGNVVKGWDNILGIATGVKAEVAEIDREAARMTLITDSQALELKTSKQTLHEINLELLEIQKKKLGESLSGTDRKRFDVEESLRKDSGSINAEEQKKIGTVAKPFDDEIDAHKKELADAKKKWQEAQAFWGDDADISDNEKKNRLKGVQDEYGPMVQNLQNILTDAEKRKATAIDAIQSHYSEIRTERESEAMASGLRLSAEELSEKDKAFKREFGIFNDFQTKKAEAEEEANRNRLSAGGHEDEARIAEIESKFAKMKAAASASAETAIESSGSGDASDYAAGVRADVVSLNASYDDQMKSEIDAYRNSSKKLKEESQKGFLDSIATPEEKFVSKLQELRREYSAGIIDATALARGTVADTQALQDELASRTPQINLSGPSVNSGMGGRNIGGPTVASPLEAISKNTADQIKATLNLAKINQQQLDLARKDLKAKTVINF